MAVISFVLSYVYSGDLVSSITAQWAIQDTFALFCFEALRFIGSGAVAFGVGTILVKMGAVNKQMAFETWVNPVADFFDRYGLKLALVLLLLIGFIGFRYYCRCDFQCVLSGSEFWQGTDC